MSAILTSSKVLPPPPLIRFLRLTHCAAYTVNVVLDPSSDPIGIPASVSTNLTNLPNLAMAPSFPTSLGLGPVPSSQMFIVTTSQSTPVGTYTLTASGTTDTGSRSGTTILVVITAAQAAQNLINLINSMGLQMGTQTSLNAPLGQEVSAILAMNLSAACNKLDTFIMKVANDLAQGRLTPAQASLLTQQANLIKISLGC